MPIRTEERVIDGTWFQVTQLPPMRSTLLVNRLAKSAGPALLSAVAEGKVDELDARSVIQGFAKLLQNLSDDDLKAIITELLAVSFAELPQNKERVPIMPHMFDEVFADRMPTMFKVLAFALEVNYRSFFGGAVKRLVEAGGRAAAKSGFNFSSALESQSPGPAGA